MPATRAQDAVVIFADDVGRIFLGSGETITTTTVTGAGRVTDASADAVENTSAITGEGVAAGGREAADGDGEGAAAVVVGTAGGAGEQVMTLLEASADAVNDTAEDNAATAQQAVDDAGDALARLLDAEGIVPDAPGDDLPGPAPGDGADDPADGGNENARALARACGPSFSNAAFPWQEAPGDGDSLLAGTGVRQDCLQPESGGRRTTAPLREVELFEKS